MGENRGQFLRWNHFELGVCAIARLFVASPSAELRDVAEAAALHVIVGDFNYQFGTYRFPG